MLERSEFHALETGHYYLNELASDIYIHQMSKLLKNTSDRFFTFNYPKHRPMLGIKRAIFIYSQRAPIPLLINIHFSYFRKISQVNEH